VRGLEESDKCPLARDILWLNPLERLSALQRVVDDVGKILD